MYIRLKNHASVYNSFYDTAEKSSYKGKRLLSGNQTLHDNTRVMDRAARRGDEEAAYF